MAAMALRSRPFNCEGHTNASLAPTPPSHGTDAWGRLWVTFTGSCSDDSLMVLVGDSWGDKTLSLGGVPRVTGGLTPMSPSSANLSEGGD